MRQRLASALPWFVAPALIAVLVATWLARPEFYLRYVLDAERREGQAVEIVTAGSAALAAALLLFAAWRLRRTDRRRREGGAAGTRSAQLLLLLNGLAAIVFLGEELSWGQWIFGWKTPQSWREHTPETNLHNMDLPISLKSLGNLWLMAVFFALPLAWALRRRMRLRLPAGLAPAVPGGAVIFTMAVAFVWDDLKDVYRWFAPDWQEQALYWQFVEQMPEHKEMLVAVAMAMYGIEIMRRRSAAAGRVPAEPAEPPRRT